MAIVDKVYKDDSHPFYVEVNENAPHSVLSTSTSDPSHYVEVNDNATHSDPPSIHQAKRSDLPLNTDEDISKDGFATINRVQEQVKSDLSASAVPNLVHVISTAVTIKETNNKIQSQV